MSFDGLISSTEISTRKISDKKSSYLSKNILENELDKYLHDGWEHIPTKLKTRERIRKAKAHNVAFEDRVWAMLAKMQFKYLNKDYQFKIEYAAGLSKQIDVFGFDEETAIVIECKSSASIKRANYNKDINEYIGLKEKLRNSIREKCGSDCKVAFLFITNNSIISQNDKERLKNDNIWHFNQDDLEYFELLTDHLGPAAKYQLFARLFAGQKVPGLKNKVPAIKGKMNNGQIFYSFSIEPEFLLKIGFILHRVETTPDSAGAYQRLVKKNRLIEIGKYVDNGGYFPNSIIINIEKKNGNELKFEQASNKHDSITSLGVLHLPQLYKSAFIIDGQHRLYGFSRSKKPGKHLVPVVAFCNLPHEEQSNIFVDINHKQTSVPANLLRSIMADFNWDSDNASLAISALKTRILADMNYDESSPLYKRIILSEEKKTEKRCLTLQTLVSWGFKRIELFGKTKGKELVRTGHLFDGNYDDTLKKSIEFFNICFQEFEEKLAIQWNIGSGESGFISMNNGISAVLLIITDILDFLVSKKGVKPDELSGGELAKQVTEYLDPVINFIDALDSEGIKKLRSLFGASAPEKILKEFQYAIHQDYNDFNPLGLQQWIKEHSGQFNAKSYEIGTFIEKTLIHDFIEKTLKIKYGEENWWTEGVPPRIQIECSKRRIEKKSKEHDGHFLDLIDYREIINNSWDIFGNSFTPPGLGSVAKSKRIEWIVTFNSIRQKYSHPQRENTTEKDYEFLVNTKEWLNIKLS